MAGVPLLNGFLSKEMFFTETVMATQPGGVAPGALAWLLPLGATIAGICSVAYSARFIHDVFFNGEPVGLPKTPHEPPAFMRVPVEVLVLVCLAVGLAPAWTVAPVLAAGAQAALYGGPVGELPEYSLRLWHGLNLPLAMSALALAAGLALYFGLQRRVNLHRIVRLPLWIERGGREFFDDLTGWLRRTARALTDALANGSLQRYLLLLVLMALAAGALPFLDGGLPARRDDQAVAPPFVVLWLVGCAAAVGTVLAYRSRLLALVLLGAVGLVVSLLFVYLSAPDLALTQLLVEIATIVLMMLALHWLPQESAREPSRARQTLHAAVAMAAGAGIAALTWAVQLVPVDRIAPYFLEHAAAAGRGQQCRQRDPRRLPRLRHARRNHVLGIAALVVHACARRASRPGPARRAACRTRASASR